MMAHSVGSVPPEIAQGHDRRCERVDKLPCWKSCPTPVVNSRKRLSPETSVGHGLVPADPGHGMIILSFEIVSQLPGRRSRAIRRIDELRHSRLPGELSTVLHEIQSFPVVLPVVPAAVNEFLVLLVGNLVLVDQKRLQIDALTNREARQPHIKIPTRHEHHPRGAGPRFVKGHAEAFGAAWCRDLHCFKAVLLESPAEGVSRKGYIVYRRKPEILPVAIR